MGGVGSESESPGCYAPVGGSRAPPCPPPPPPVPKLPWSPAGQATPPPCRECRGQLRSLAERPALRGRQGKGSLVPTASLRLSLPVPAMPSLFMKVLNSTAVQATWEPSVKLGQHEGFKLYYRKVHLAHFTGPVLLPGNVTSYNITHLGASGAGGWEEGGGLVPGAPQENLDPAPPLTVDSFPCPPWKVPCPPTSSASSPPSVLSALPPSMPGGEGTQPPGQGHSPPSQRQEPPGFQDGPADVLPSLRPRPVSRLRGEAPRLQSARRRKRHRPLRVPSRNCRKSR